MDTVRIPSHLKHIQLLISSFVLLDCHSYNMYPQSEKWRAVRLWSCTITVDSPIVTFYHYVHSTLQRFPVH